MLVYASCVLLAASTLAVRYPGNERSYGQQTANRYYPIDYSDDLHINNPLIPPGSNIIYNFGQMRRDQPPQIEMREENVGKYMYRRPQTTTTTTTTTTTPVPTTTITTTTPEPTTTEEEIPADIPNSKQFVSQSRYPEEDRSPSMSRMTAPSPALTLSNFDEFSIELPDSSRIKPEARYPPINTWRSQVLSTPPPTPLPKWQEFERERYQPHSQHNPMSNWNPNQEFAQEPSTLWQEFNNRAQPEYFQSKMIEDQTAIQSEWPEAKPQQSFRNIANRGHHKFKWEDLLDSTPATPIQKAPTAPAAPQKRPLPTLTPWSGDDFGK